MNFPDIEITSFEKIFNRCDNLVFAVLPGSSLDSSNSEMYLSTILNDKFYLIVEGVKNLDDYFQLSLGAFINLRMENDKIRLSKVDTLQHENGKEIGFKYNPGKSIKSIITKSIKFNKGVSTVINGVSDSGKTTYATEIADGFEKNGFITYRVSIGQRRGDSLGSNTIYIDSETSPSSIMMKLYYVLYLNIKHAHEGFDSVLIMDSLDKLISLCNLSKNNTRRTMRFLNGLIIISGNFKNGSFTVIATNDIFHKENYQRLNATFKDFLHTGMFKKELKESRF